MPGRPLRSFCVGATAELVCIGLMARHGDFLRAGEAWKFTVCALLAGVAFAWAAGGFTRAAVPGRAGTRWFWIVAVVLRLAMLPSTPGDDLWRYRWEGKIQGAGFNPYLLAPDAPALADLRDGEWQKINHQDFPAIYPPLTELTFAALARAGVPVLGYKLLFALADLGVAGILRWLLTRRRVSPEIAVWYAWNPLAVYASAGAAHFDSLMILTLMGAVWCLDRVTTCPPGDDAARAWRVPPLAWASALLLGMSVALKVVPAVLLPVWFFALGWRRALWTLPVAVGITPALAVFYGFPGVRVFGALGNFARGFRVNDAVWWLVDPAGRTGGVCPVVAAVVCGALAVWFRRDWRRGALWVFGAALLLGPALHAWYVVWMLPLAVWRGESARAWVVLSVSVFGYFLLWDVNHASGRPWEEPLWLRLLIYLPPLTVLGWTTAIRPLTHVSAA